MVFATYRTEYVNQNGKIDRGALAAGMAADITVFDPATVIATPAEAPRASIRWSRITPPKAARTDFETPPGCRSPAISAA